jgi:PAS domain-containing protein
MATKVQSQLLVAELTRDRADALRLVRSEPRAEIWRLAIEGNGLAALEEAHRTQLEALDNLAAIMGMTRLQLAARAARDGLWLRDLEGRKRYPRTTKAGAAGA